MAVMLPVSGKVRSPMSMTTSSVPASTTLTSAERLTGEAGQVLRALELEPRHGDFAADLDVDCDAWNAVYEVYAGLLLGPGGRRATERRHDEQQRAERAKEAAFFMVLIPCRVAIACDRVPWPPPMKADVGPEAAARSPSRRRCEPGGRLLPHPPTQSWLRMHGGEILGCSIRWPLMTYRSHPIVDYRSLMTAGVATRRRARAGSKSPRAHSPNRSTFRSARSSGASVSSTRRGRSCCFVAAVAGAAAPLEFLVSLGVFRCHQPRRWDARLGCTSLSAVAAYGYMISVWMVLLRTSVGRCPSAFSRRRARSTSAAVTFRLASQSTLVALVLVLASCGTITHEEASLGPPDERARRSALGPRSSPTSPESGADPDSRRRSGPRARSGAGGREELASSAPPTPVSTDPPDRRRTRASPSAEPDRTVGPATEVGPCGLLGRHDGRASQCRAPSPPVGGAVPRGLPRVRALRGRRR